MANWCGSQIGVFMTHDDPSGGFFTTPATVLYPHDMSRKANATLYAISLRTQHFLEYTDVLSMPICVAHLKIVGSTTAGRCWEYYYSAAVESRHMVDQATVPFKAVIYVRITNATGNNGIPEFFQKNLWKYIGIV